MCLLPLVMMVGLSGSRLTDGDGQRQQAFDSSRVPPAHVKWVIRAGSVCDIVTPSVVAAQIDAETGWLAGTAEGLPDTSPTPSPTAPTPSEPRALVGLSTSAFKEWGSDDDGNGTATPLDPGDAIMALGRFDCALAEGVQRLKESRAVSGDTLELTLAAYHSGLDTVERSRGVPEGEARDYVRRVQKLIPRYETGSGR
ncbi:lytic transglycosylase domain-containing protein [Streptomyces sp. MA5143a]|uniref:lytic transglycosylase domain-containing protein n=1 Tax=Streptomyces sp. MA5143a TaxID=2083010 RepID=UPI0011B26C79|nr:lytic transglycosylase domain-containing protein [Streptomyces sp. MA5143a]